MASSSNTAGAFDAIIPSASTFDASSSGTNLLPYHIFINHCGKDTKHNVASKIYESLDATGLRVFLDKPELNLEDLLPKALEQAMASASICIAIFSEHYAQSPWCLAELEYMVKRGKTIIPIFYHVDPSVLRWAVGGKRKYAEAFLEHEQKKRYSPEVLQRWKEALQQDSFSTGSIINNTDDEQRAVKNVVNRVMKEMNTVPLEVAKHPVGLDEAVQDFYDTIALQSAGSTQMVGIWGMGGSGKTTLAKEIFNRRSSAMDWSSFLSDVRDADRKGLLLEKQKTLLKDLGAKDERFDNVDKGKQIIENRLSRNVSLLIVLDDVDHRDQLDALLPPKESLGDQSLIIVTTRNANVLLQWGISAIYQMRPLNDTHAKQLFCWHAFLKNSPPSEFEDLVEEFLYACQGLPLSLKVLGGQLYGKTEKEYWQRAFNKFSQIPHEDIAKRLKVSYDALGKQEKEMFLDAACLFIGERKTRAIAAWDAEKTWDGFLGWETLFNKCLVEEDRYGKIRMHERLRDLGRDIANGQSPHRLWSPHQIIKTPPQQEAVQIRGIVNAVGDRGHQRQGKIVIHTSQGKLSLAPCSLGLKIFVGNGDFLNQEHSELGKELIWLQCEKFEHKNLSTCLSLKKLRILELSNSMSLEYLWQRQADAPLQLRELVIRRCKSWLGFPSSIGHLKNLEKILISGDDHVSCDALSGLPQEFCDLQSLEHLEIKHCTNLSSLPSKFGNLRNLRHLSLSCCFKLEALPDSFKELTLLEYLNLNGCSELTIKSELDILKNMKRLRYLNLDECSKLEDLRLPEVSALRNLHLKNSGLKELPANIFQLTRLTELQIQSEFLTILPTSVENLISLNKLIIKGCENLKSLPDSLKDLYNLRDLTIENTGVKCLPKSLIHLQSLTIKDTPISELSFGSWCMLKSINLCSTKVSKISIGGDCCRFLEELMIVSNKDLRELETLPASLKTIHIYDCDVLKDIGGIRHLKNLQSLHISGCGKLDELPNLAELVFLEEFDLNMCHKLKKLEGLEKLRSLRKLRIYQCPGLEGLPSLAELTNLKNLDLDMCDKLEKIEGLDNLRSLDTFSIHRCSELDGLLNLAGFMKSLKIIKIYDCLEVKVLPNLGELISLKEFELKRCHKLQKIEGLEKIRLQSLRISDCPELDGLPSLTELTSIKDFDLQMWFND